MSITFPTITCKIHITSVTWHPQNRLVVAFFPYSYIFRLLLCKISNIHRSRKKNITSPRYPSLTLNNNQYVANLESLTPLHPLPFCWLVIFSFLQLHWGIIYNDKCTMQWVLVDLESSTTITTSQFWKISSSHKCLFALNPHSHFSFR